MKYGEFGFYSYFVLVYIVTFDSTVKPVLRGHLWDKTKWPYKTGGLSKEVQFIIITLLPFFIEILQYDWL